MKTNSWVMTIGTAVLGLCAVMPAVRAAAPASETELRAAAQKTMQNGNYKDAFGLFEKLCLDPATDQRQIGGDLNQAVQCLLNLNQPAETDAFREKVLAANPESWRLLWAAAQNLMQTQHWGFIIGGKFERGQSRGEAKYVDCYERDRVQALQWLAAAMEKSRTEKERRETAALFLNMTDMLQQSRFGNQAWRLQYLTDLTKLPDYEEQRYFGGSGSQGAPVDEKGNPVFHKIPESWEKAATDGERWRWCLVQAMELDPGNASAVKYRFANFLHQQFDVQTLAQYGDLFGDGEEDGKDNGAKTGIFAVDTLGEDETIARLATGVKRFKLPAEFNFIKIYQDIANAGQGSYVPDAITTLASLFENRRQYDKAVQWWEKYKTFNKKMADDRIRQITGNWGQFEPVMTFPAGKVATVDFRFRNGKAVHFIAEKIRVRALLDDIKAYLKSAPNQVDWEKINIGNIGYLMVTQNGAKYLGDKVAEWDMELKPRPQHFDRRVTVATPLKEAGAYLLTGTMKDGNLSRIIVWLDDTVLVKKPLDQQTLYFVGDAAAGTPVARANVEFFGWRQEWVDGTKSFKMHVTNFAESTDADGKLLLGEKQVPQDYQWLITATTQEGRLAFLGFTGVWYGQQYDQEYNEIKTLVITDRPVYRPAQKVKFKAWVRHAKYDQENSSDFAGQSFQVEIYNPQGEKVFEKDYTADAYGGLDGELELAKDAALGVYSLQVVNQGGGTFRVEEYKKPEFEVKVEAPTEPVMLGETIAAKVIAKYYFGAPVTEAKVKYKVLRYNHNARWFPIMYWDWFYGPGYWWFAYDYDWYPGWRNWGCRRPLPWWIGEQGTPPEVVLDSEAEIGKDGTLVIKFDTALAKAIHGDMDHRYEITAEVTDQSRRTITGQGNVLVARKPFTVYAWVDRGYYRSGDVIHAEFQAQTLDQKPVVGKGELKLFRISYDKGGKAQEKVAQEWKLNPDGQGHASQQLTASKAGQYRLAWTVTDAKGHAIEGGYIFIVRGDGFDGRDFRFSQLELVTDKREYAPGEKVKLMINTDRADSTVALFIRPANGICQPPQILRLKGKSTVAEIEISKKDMPNIFIEAFTIADGKIYSELREIIVPPEKRVLNVEVTPSQDRFKPGDKGTVRIKLTDFAGKPFVGSTVISVYDKAVEYISGGGNVPEIREFFWKWRRSHNIQTESSLTRSFYNMLKNKEPGMANLGIFGDLNADEMGGPRNGGKGRALGFGGGGRMMRKSMAGGAELQMAPVGMSMDSVAAMPASAAPAMEMAGNGMMMAKAEAIGGGMPGGMGGGGEPPPVEPVVRTQFADTALWIAALETDPDGFAKIDLTLPENLTTWKIKVWAMGHGTKVGENAAEVVTTKDLILRLQAPRFFVQKDEVVLSANIHNFLKTDKTVTARLELDGPCLQAGDKTEVKVEIKAGGEARVDWRVKVLEEGEAVVRMKALSDEDSDAMEMKFPVYVHGMDKLVPVCGVIRPDRDKAQVTLNVPAERRVNASRLEIRYSPTLAMAMIDALPYLVDYPYGCTEQTLNRFLPTVITQRVLQRMGVSLQEVKEKTTNLNAQELGDPKARAKQWQRYDRNPVFDEAEVQAMIKDGVRRLTNMQLTDGGWGWFSGSGEYSSPHTTAQVVHGLLVARDNDVAIVPGVIERGVDWLKNYQQEQVTRLKNAQKDPKKEPWKEQADDLDAYVYRVLAEAKVQEKAMMEYLYRDRTKVSVYAKALYGLALEGQGEKEKLAMILQNIGQYLVRDDENQTAWLNLGNDNYWWYWYGSEIEAHAAYLQLLSRTEPKGDDASRLVKYLLNNRKHATWWNSTRDTALCLEAFADYIKGSGEDKPDMTVEVLVNGRKMKEVKITAENLFTFDSTVVLLGDAVETGRYDIELRRKGAGPLYFNTYLSYFTLEDFITKAGLEVKVERTVYKLTAVDATTKVAGSRGQAVDQKVEKYERTELPTGAKLKSGDLVEVELVIESKNDYEYLIFEDMKAAGFEPVEVRSGYNGNSMGAYVEFRDERVAFFVRWLARGKHSVSYRIRAEIPGSFSALPAKGYAMYAPELRGNSDEIKLNIED